MIVFLFFIFLICASALAVIFFGFRNGKRALKFQTSVLIFIYVISCYFIAFLLNNVHPYWTDNGAEEFIPFADRWKWATLDFYLVAILLCPLLFLGYKIFIPWNFKESNKKTNT